MASIHAAAMAAPPRHLPSATSDEMFCIAGATPAPRTSCRTSTRAASASGSGTTASCAATAAADSCSVR